MDRTISELFEKSRYPIEMFGGRDIGAGHLRGWGLEYGELYEKHLSKDPLFVSAFNAAQDRGSLLTLHKLCNLYLIIRYAMPEDHGDIFEFGSFTGGSAVFMATLLKQLGRKSKVLAFDTFAGMPPTDAIRDMHSEGDFNETGYTELLQYIGSKELDANMRTVQGTFDETLPGVLAEGGDVGMIHVDCDIYEPIKYVIRTCLGHMPARTHVAFDDPLHGSCLGAFDAVQELMIRELNLTAEQAYPHLVFRCP